MTDTSERETDYSPQDLFVPEESTTASDILDADECRSMSDYGDDSADINSIDSSSELLEGRGERESSIEDNENLGSTPRFSTYPSANISSDERSTDIEDFELDVPPAQAHSNQDDNIIVIPTQDPSTLNTKKDNSPNTKHNIPTIDLVDEEQQVVEILDDEEDDLELKKSKKPPESYKPVKDYKCPICFEPPEMAMMTQCGHVFCCDCLFQMVNNSNPNRNLHNVNMGLCALCRSKVDLRSVVLIRMKKGKIKTKIKK